MPASRNTNTRQVVVMAVSACQMSPMQFTVHIAGKRVRCPHGSRRRGAYFGRLRLYCVAKRVAHLTCRLRKPRRIPHQMASSTAHGAVTSTGERFAPRGGCGRTTGHACTLLSVVAGNMYSGKFANQCPPQTFCCVRPNPSLKRSANGRPPGPGPRYGVHFLSPGPGVLPSSPA